MTHTEMQRFVADLNQTLESRGYTNCNVRLSVGGESVALTGSLYFDSSYEYLNLTIRDMSRLDLEVQTYINDKFPPEPERLKKDFNEAMAALAAKAEKIGLDVPEYDKVAKILRDTMASNLLTKRDL